MRIRNCRTLEEKCLPTLVKKIDGKDVSLRGAFPEGSMLELSMRIPRKLGIRAVVIRICRDGEGTYDIPFSFFGMELGMDVYSLTLPLSREMCHGDSCLFYYEFLFLRGFDTLFSNTNDNVRFSLGPDSGQKFRMTVFKRDFSVPDWFSGGVMYHVFVDRFCRGEGPVGEREDAVLDTDWEGGTPEFPEQRGGVLKNNRFFGGNLWGIAQKLPYLSSLGVTVLYLSPIFKAYSNHKYDTGDYEVIDEMFGGEQAFEYLIKEAGKYHIRILLDGVFNHTGDDSRYFNKYGKYKTLGAFQSEKSPFRDWYCFNGKRYESWWGIPILPKLNPASNECRNYLAGQGGIAEKYVKMGMAGWRLDVADELSDEFLETLRSTVKKVDPEAILIGEVWENAADKISYGHRRRYFCGKQLDSVMNYPLKDAILAFLLRGDAEFFARTLTDLYSSYPKDVCDALMNLVGTHDTQRILTVLSGVDSESMSNRELSVFRLDQAARKNALEKLKIAAILEFTVFGVPSIFYGDEAGMEGGRDPFCRRPYPWGREDKSLVEYYSALGRIRREQAVFKHGEFEIMEAANGFLCYRRFDPQTTDEVYVLANAGNELVSYQSCSFFKNILTGDIIESEIRVAPMSALILKKESTVKEQI